MSASFWQRAMNVPQPPRQPAAYQPQPQQPYPGYNGSPAAPQQPAPAYQGYQVPEGLAAAPPAHVQDQSGAIAAQQGYIRKPPGWVQTQPGDRCPNCGGVNFVFSGGEEGTAGMKRRTKAGEVRFGHCFDCAYTMNGSMPLSSAQVGNFGSVGLGGGRTVATRQSHSLGQNFYRIEGKIG